MTEETGRLDGDRIFYRSWVAASRRAHVVIAHGYAEHSGRYTYVGERLAESGYASWAIDHRGHGRSPGIRGDIESIKATVDDLDLLVAHVEAEAGGLPVFLLGHSMGGAIATAYAEEHQTRLAGLALSAPALMVPPELLALADLDEIPEFDLSFAVSSDPAVVQAYLDDPLTVLGPPSRGFLVAMRGIEAVYTRLSELSLPILVMHGSGDLLVTPSTLATVVAGVSSPDVTARMWPGLFHEIFNEPQKARVIATLVAWLDEHVDDG